MPELPEVEVVKKSLESQINNLTIKSIKINDSNLRYKVKKHDISIGIPNLESVSVSFHLRCHLDSTDNAMKHAAMKINGAKIVL